MGFYEDRVLPWAIDKVMNTGEIHKMRAQVCEGLSGEVLEVGFGSGLNLDHYPDEVDRVLAVDPAMLGRKLAAHRLARNTTPVDFVGLDGQHLPLEDNSVDSVLCTWTLCTIPDALLALSEIKRVMRDGGTFHFVEHGLAHDPSAHRLQHRLTPAWKKVAGGCHLNRSIDELITDAGFTIDFERIEGTGPKSFASMYLGTARVSN